MKGLSNAVCVIAMLGIHPIAVCCQDAAYDYLGQTPPGDTPVIFAPGIVSIDNKNTHSLVVSPDGKMILFSRYPDRTSYILKKEKDTWTGPVQSFFYGKEVSFSPDGQKIFYYTSGDIYSVERNSSGWSGPVRLGPNVNTNGVLEYYPCIVGNGDLYFSRDGHWSKARLMHSKWINGAFDAAEDLGPSINSGGALHAWFPPDEQYVLFNSPRVGSHTQLDIWISYRKDNGMWSEPKNPGETINSGADAILCPTVSPDGRYLFFTKMNFRSNTGTVYWVRTSIFDGLENSGSTETEQER